MEHRESAPECEHLMYEASLSPQRVRPQSSLSCQGCCSRAVFQRLRAFPKAPDDPSPSFKYLSSDSEAEILQKQKTDTSQALLGLSRQMRGKPGPGCLRHVWKSC